MTDSTGVDQGDIDEVGVAPLPLLADIVMA